MPATYMAFPLHSDGRPWSPIGVIRKIDRRAESFCLCFFVRVVSYVRSCTCELRDVVTAALRDIISIARKYLRRSADQPASLFRIKFFVGRENEAMPYAFRRLKS